MKILLPFLAAFAPILALAAPPAELFQSESCKITAWVLVQKTKQKVSVTGADAAFKLTFSDREFTYKMEFVYSHEINGQSSEELNLTRAVTEAGEKDNEKIVSSDSVSYSMPLPKGDLTTTRTSGSYRYTQKDASTVLIQSLETEPAKKTPDTLQTTKTTAPGVQTITSKSLGPNPALQGIQVLSTIDACSYAVASENVMPGTDFYAAVPNAVDEFRAQFDATRAAEDAADSCKAALTDCAALAQAAKDAVTARDDLWAKLFQ